MRAVHVYPPSRYAVCSFLFNGKIWSVILGMTVSEVLKLLLRYSVGNSEQPWGDSYAVAIGAVAMGAEFFVEEFLARVFNFFR